MNEAGPISSFNSTFTINRLTEEQYHSLSDDYFNQEYHNFEFFVTEDDGEEQSKVSKIIAGDNIAISPTSGEGEVTISAIITKPQWEISSNKKYSEVILSGNYKNGGGTFSFVTLSAAV